MTKKLAILIFLVCSITTNAQNSELLNGKWVFKKALNKEVDKEGRKTLNSDIINKMTFKFDSNGEFTAFAFGQNMEGKWTISEDLKMLSLSTGKEKYIFAILKLTESDLILKLGLGEFLMKKL